MREAESEDVDIGIKDVDKRGLVVDIERKKVVDNKKVVDIETTN